MTVQEYLREKVLYGGETMMRGEVIADLRKCLPPDHPNPERAIDTYLMGLDRRMERVTQAELDQGERVAKALRKRRAQT